MGKTGKRKDRKEIEQPTDNMSEELKAIYISHEDISLCEHCYSMTHTIAGKCGKCKEKK